MEQHLAQEINEKDRWQFLCDNADSVEQIGYTHRFTPEELAQKKNIESSSAQKCGKNQGDKGIQKIDASPNHELRNFLSVDNIHIAHIMVSYRQIYYFRKYF